MFTRASVCLIPLILSGVLLMHPPLVGQQMNSGRAHLEDKVIEAMEEERYREALDACRELRQSDPGNPQYRYYLGRCLVELNRDLDEAVELLHRGSSGGAPADADYYLGLAYHRRYDFREAAKHFARYQDRAGRKERKDHRIGHLMATTASAADLTAWYNPYEVINVTFIDLLDSAQFTQIKMKGGQLRRKPDRYFSSAEDRNDLNSLMFIPRNTVRGDYLYYAGYGRNMKEGLQLFRVRKGGARSWSDPEEIKALNSEGDEILPYFDPIENDLYFASDGREGIGGFDLYRSHYDRERDEWSEPINLGFPVNSVMDEYLLLPGSDLGMVMFFTTRQATDTTVTVYRVHLVEPRKKTKPGDREMLRDIASLGGAAEDARKELALLTGEIPPAVGVPDRDLPVAEAAEQGGRKQEEQKNLAKALMHQAASDSLKDLATEARREIRTSDDPNDRWVWQKQILLWEKKSRDEQEMANALFREVDLELAAEPAAAAGLPAAIEVDTVMEDLTLYGFRGSQAPPEGEPGTAPDPVSWEPAERKVPDRTGRPAAGIISPRAENPGTAPVNRFQILPASPYNSSNPIPLDVPVPSGSFYRIQLGAFGEKVEPATFGGISPVTGEPLPGRGLVKYYAGKFSRYDDAAVALTRVRSLGFEDAFIVAWYNGRPISTRKAKQLE